jgi:hypothetical protein
MRFALLLDISKFRNIVCTYFLGSCGVGWKPVGHKYTKKTLRLGSLEQKKENLFVVLSKLHSIVEQKKYINTQKIFLVSNQKLSDPSV